MHLFRRRLLPARIGSLVLALALVGGGAVGIPASVAGAQGTGSISGTVENGTSQPIANVCIVATNGNDTGGTTSSSSGSFTISNLAPGDYVVFFDPGCDGVVSSPYGYIFWGNAIDISSATEIAVGSQPVTGLNQILTSGGSISGVVMNAASIGLANVCLYVYSPEGNLVPLRHSTNGSGDFTISNLAVTGVGYRLRVDPTCVNSTSSPYAIEWYENASDFGVATPIPVTSPGVSGVDTTLQLGGSISGTVSGSGITDGSGVCVAAYAPDSYLVNVASTITDGTYEIDGLPSNGYKVLFDPTCGGQQASDFARNYYGGSSAFSSGTSLQVTAGQQISGINGVLSDASPPSVSPSSLPDASVTGPYAQTIGATGGTAPYTVSVGGLPAGLSFNSSTGAISGTPISAGSASVTVDVTDSSVPPVTITSQISINVDGPPPSPPSAPTTTTLPANPPPLAPIAPPKATVKPLVPALVIRASSTPLLDHGKEISVTVSCEHSACIGAIEIARKITTRETVKVKSGRKTVLETKTVTSFEGLGTVSFHIAGGVRGIELIKLSPTGRGLLDRASARAPIRESLVTTLHGGKGSTSTITVT